MRRPWFRNRVSCGWGLVFLSLWGLIGLSPTDIDELKRLVPFLFGFLVVSSAADSTRHCEKPSILLIYYSSSLDDSGGDDRKSWVADGRRWNMCNTLVFDPRIVFLGET